MRMRVEHPLRLPNVVWGEVGEGAAMSRADLHARLAYALAGSAADRRPAARRDSCSAPGSARSRRCSPTPWSSPTRTSRVPRCRASPATPGRLVVVICPAPRRARHGGRAAGARARLRGLARRRTSAFGARVLCLPRRARPRRHERVRRREPRLGPGDLVRITDHLNLSGQNPLAGRNDDRLGPRFPDLTYAYDPRARRRPRRGRRPSSGSRSSVASTPAWPAPATRRPPRSGCCARSGADLVGMSTVPEVIAARHMGVPVAGVSLVTNRAAGLAGKPLSHVEVAAVAAREGARLGNSPRHVPRRLEV